MNSTNPPAGKPESFVEAYQRIAAYMVLAELEAEVKNLRAAFGVGAETKQGRLDRELVTAAREGRLADVDVLLWQGADPRAQRGAALVSAATLGHGEVLRLLVTHGADISAQDHAAFIRSAAGGYRALAEFLHKQGGISPLAIDKALPLAAGGGHAEAASWLLGLGAGSVSEALAAAAAGGHASVLQILLESGPLLARDNPEALAAAAERGQGAAVMLLLEAGARVDAEKGLALRRAAARGQDEVIGLMLGRGAQSSPSALRAAALNGREGAAAALLEGGAEPDRRLLADVLKTRDYGMAALLLEHGADSGVISTRDLKGLQAYAEGRRHWLAVAGVAPPAGLEEKNPAWFHKDCFDGLVTILTEHEGYDRRAAHLAAYDIAALFQTSERVLGYLEKWGPTREPDKSEDRVFRPLHDLTRKIALPETVCDLTVLGDAALARGPAGLPVKASPKGRPPAGPAA
jgi:ankyrin repeat protein